MKYARTAVFERHFSFVLATIVCILILVSLSGCDTQNMEDLLNSTDCTITFVLNNGEDNVVWRKGDKVPAPSKKDYEFLYWCSDSDLTTRADIDFDNFVLASNITVYAKWKELGYKVQRGQKAIASFCIWKHTVKEASDETKEDESKMFMKKASFFKFSQVEKMK